MLTALKGHWPEYAMEAAELAIVLLAACLFSTLLEHPDSAVRHAVPSPVLRRVLLGLGMGSTVAAVVYSPWGQQSGAHFNPAVTLTFFRLGKVEPWDALFYILAHFVGAPAGVFVGLAVFGGWLAHPAVRYAVTVPGNGGAEAAFLAELVISFALMALVLVAINTPRLAPLAGGLVGALVWVFIATEAPASGASMNPARTVGSAVPAQVWTAVWVYFAAPAIGMLVAAEAYLRLRGWRHVKSAKLHHANGRRCIFRCDHHWVGATLDQGGVHGTRRPC